MNALTAVKPTPAPVAQQYPGFSFTPSAQSPRLLELTFSAETTTQFLQQVAQWPVQALEYKSFLRFQVGKILDDLCGNQLQPLLIKTLLDRAEGALLINGEGIDNVSQAEEMVKLAIYPDNFTEELETTIQCMSSKITSTISVQLMPLYKSPHITKGLSSVAVLTGRGGNVTISTSKSLGEKNR